MNERRSPLKTSLNKSEIKAKQMALLQNTMRWGWMVIIKLTVFVVVILALVFSGIMIHWSLAENVNFKDLGDFAYNYWFGIGVFTTGLIAVAGGSKAIQKIGEIRSGKSDAKN